MSVCKHGGLQVGSTNQCFQGALGLGKWKRKEARIRKPLQSWIGKVFLFSVQLYVDTLAQVELAQSSPNLAGLTPPDSLNVSRLTRACGRGTGLCGVPMCNILFIFSDLEAETFQTPTASDPVWYYCNKMETQQCCCWFSCVLPRWLTSLWTMDSCAVT